MSKKKKNIQQRKKKNTPKPVKRRRRKIVIKKKSNRNPNIVEIESLLKKINHVQVNREEIKVVIAAEDRYVVDNLLKDADLEFTKEYDEKKCPDVAIYVIGPGPEREEGSHALEDLEALDDEILEDDHIF